MKNRFKQIGLILLVCALIAASGCSPGVSQEDLDDLDSQLDELESQLDDLEDEFDALQDSTPPEEQAQTSTVTEADTAEEDENVTEDTSTETTQDPSSFDEASVLELLEITEYTYFSSYSNYVFLRIKNNSAYDITLYGEIIFKNADGDLVGTSSNEAIAFEAGEEMMLDFYTDSDFANYEYSLSAGLEDYYAPVLSSLSLEVTTTESKAILAVTNNGDIAAQFVQYIVLFFNGDSIVDYDWGYCTDDDSEIKPGKTNYEEAKSYEEFDSVLVFLSGRAYNE